MARTLSVVSGDIAASLVTQADANAAIRDAFMALDHGDATLFPSTRGSGSDAGTRFGVKVAYDGIRRVPGLKVGSYWPQNHARGLPNHGSTTLLLDDETGFPYALVEATYLNALRTAASDAVAVDALARADATVLAVVGTGNQSWFDVHAISLVRPLSKVFVAGRNVAGAETLATRLREDGFDAQACAVREAVTRADIIVTLTAAREPLFAAGDVRPGTHISAMGADGPGKQELDPALALATGAELFADTLDQTFTIGEFQYLAGLPRAADIRTLGAVLNGKAAGRTHDDAITLYDSSGIALQDIAIAAVALDRAREKELTQELAF